MVQPFLASLVAMKILKNISVTSGVVRFQIEVEMIILVVHKNLSQLYGIFMTHIARLLVYPYRPNGSVAYHLRGLLSSLILSCVIFLPNEMCIIKARDTCIKWQHTWHMTHRHLQEHKLKWHNNKWIKWQHTWHMT